MTKSISIRISNNGTFINFDLEASKGASIQRVQKALVYRFFDFYDTMRGVGAKAFKATMPFNIAMKIDGVVLWDTSVSTHLEAKLKLINNPKGRHKFETRLTKIMEFAIRCANQPNPEKIIEDVEQRLLEVIGE
jgi:hypothetical protein